MRAEEAVSISNTYTENTVIGMGAIKGAPCTIKSITKSGNLNTVVFEWTDLENVKHESTMLVYDGADGFSPTIVVKSSTATEYILTITDKNGSYDTPNLKGSGGGGGASAMSDLTDVDLTALANGSVLVYDSTPVKWEATALSLSDISEIDLAGITDGQILAWDATNNKFVPSDNTGEEYTAGEGIEISQDNKISSKIVMYTGTKAAWDALPLANKKKYTHASFTDDSESGVVDSTPTEDSVNLVSSGGVFAVLEEKADSATTLAGYGITDAYTKTEANNAITAEIEKLDVSDAAVAGSYVTEVSEADGKISVVREAADAVPTESSNKMVKSGGVYAALEDKADKVTSATNGNFAGLDASGNLTDSGKKASDFATAANLANYINENGAINQFDITLSNTKSVNTGGTWDGNAFTYRGLTYTVNDDNIVVTGTPTDNSFFYLLAKNIPAGRYTFGGLKDAANINWDGGFWIYNGNVETHISTGVAGTKNDFTVDLSSYTFDRIKFGIKRKSNTLTNDTIKLFIRKADINIDVNAPYAKTNRELTEELTIKNVSGYSWDSAIDDIKEITVKRYGAIVTIYGYFKSTTSLAQYANVLSGLPHCASGAAKSTDALRNMGMTLQNVDSATSKIIVDSATTANLQYAFNLVYLTDK